MIRRLFWTLFGLGLGLVLGVANMVGGYLGARMAVSRGSRFIRVVFLVVVGALILRLGYDVVRENILHNA